MEIDVTDDIRVAPESKNMISILSDAFDHRKPIGINGREYMVVAKSNSAFTLRRVIYAEADPRQWNSDGLLPPIGTVCEVVSPGYRSERFNRFIGQRVTVVAHDVIDSDPVAVFRMAVDGQVDEQDYHAMIAKCFRPVKTPEQIAEEAQQAAIQVIEDRIMARMGELNVRNLAEDLHGFLQEMAVKS